jgi:guanine deaminase
MPSHSMEAGKLSVPKAFRGRILHAVDREECIYLPDGGLLVNQEGLVEACEDWSAIEARHGLKGFEITHLPEHCLMIPGFVDLHVHLPQLDAVGCQAENLLNWLKTYIYPAEMHLADPGYARDISHRFFSGLLANGTTTAAVFLTSHPEAVQIAFETAEAVGNRVIMGQNLMDRNGPEALVRPPGQILTETEQLCRRWHRTDAGRLQYAWMPRFAVSCSDELLAGIGWLRRQAPDVYLHTHLSEQSGEILEVRRLFPWAADYTGVYERFHLLGEKTILAHGIHLSDSELTRIQASECALAHCPGSNFFLKSGRFRLTEVLRRGVLYGLGSDVGAGPEMNLFQVMKDAQYMQLDTLIPLESLFYAATLGGAKALFMDDRIGNFEPGKEADFLVLDAHGSSNFSFPEQPEAGSMLSRLVYLGDDRLVAKTFIRGRQVHGASACLARS